MEKDSIFPTQRKEEKQCLNNYRFMSPLLVYGKALERHVDMTEVDWFTGIDLFVSPQPGFKMVNSCINQLF